MKAAVLHGNDAICYEDFPMPIVMPGTVKIKVRASGICGSDVPRVLYNGAHFYPIVLGHEFSGEVVEIAEDVTKVKVGDTVTGAPRIPCLKCRDCQAGNISQCKNDTFIGSRTQGSFAEYIVIPEINTVKYDPSIPFEKAALFEPATIAARAMRNSAFKGGGYTAIIGAGTIGLFVLQWVKIFGCRNVVVLDLDKQRLEKAKNLGADFVVETSKEQFVEEALSYTQNRGFDYVFEAVGNNLTLRMALEIAGANASVCLVGTPHNSVTFAKGEWELINRKELYIKGCWQGYSAPFPGIEWELTEHYLSTGQLKVDENLIYKKIPLSQVKAAFDLYKNPSQIHGKILLVND